MKLLSIASGSSGNCIATATEQTLILVDTGISKKRIEEGLNANDFSLADVKGILVTHEHADHIQGLGVISRKYHIPIYASAGTIGALTEEKIGKVDTSLFHSIEADKDFELGDMRIHPFRISHDAAEPFAYRIYGEGTSVAVATDMGMYDDYIIENLKGVGGLVLEANHDVRMLQTGKYPYSLKQRILSNYGHLSNENSGRLLNSILHNELKKVYLGHLSKENNYERLAFEAVRMEINLSENDYLAEDFDISVAKRDEPSAIVNI